MVGRWWCGGGGVVEPNWNSPIWVSWVGFSQIFGPRFPQAPDVCCGPPGRMWGSLDELLELLFQCLLAYIVFQLWLLWQVKV